MEVTIMSELESIAMIAYFIFLGFVVWRLTQ